MARIRQGRTRKDKANPAARARSELPESPGKDLVEISVSLSQAGVGNAKKISQLFGCLEVLLVLRRKVKTLLLQSVDGIVHHLDVDFASNSWQVASPPNLSLDLEVLPRRVAEEAVETGTVTQEHLRERRREMQRPVGVDRRPHCRVRRRSGQVVRVEALGPLAGTSAVGGSEVEQRSSGSHSIPSLLMGFTSCLYLGLVCVGCERQTL